MKKMKVLLVGMLTLVMSLLCFSSCFLHYGKYTAVEHRAEVLGSQVVTELEDSKIYVELKGDNVAVYAQEVFGKQVISEGTWANGEEFGQYVMTIDNTTYNITVEGGTMTLESVVGTYILKK